MKAALTHLANREKNTPEPGGVEATCRGNWTQVCFFLPNTDSLDGLSLLSFPCLIYHPFSQKDCLYPKPMWWSHVPEGPSAQSFTFSATHIVWPEMSRQGILAGKGVILPGGERGSGGGIFQDLLGLCWHPVRLCYQLQLGIRGYSRGILGCGWGGIDLAVKYGKMCIWFVLNRKGCYSLIAYIRICFISLWNMRFIPIECQFELKFFIVQILM